MKRLLSFMAFVLVLCVFVTGCYSTSDEEKALQRSLVRDYASSFRAQAKAQYGKGAAVRKIRAEMYQHGDLIYGLYQNTTGFLLGQIKVGGEEFDARYYPGANEIYSKKNAGKILDSIKEYYGALHLDVEEVTMTNSARETPFLSDEVDSYQKMLDAREFMIIHMYVTSDLSRFKKEDFSTLQAALENYGSTISGWVTIIEPVDMQAVRQYMPDIAILNFSYSTHPKAFDEESHEKVDAFELYGIKRSIHIDYSSNEYSYNYLE